jgi:hypothetical protein
VVNTFFWLELPFIEGFVCVWSFWLSTCCGWYGMIHFFFSSHERGRPTHIIKQNFSQCAVCTFFLSNVYFGAGGGIEGLASSNFHPILWKLFIYYVLQTLYQNSLTGFSYVTGKKAEVFIPWDPNHPTSLTLFFCFGKKKAELFYSMRSKPCT